MTANNNNEKGPPFSIKLDLKTAEWMANWEVKTAQGRTLVIRAGMRYFIHYLKKMSFQARAQLIAALGESNADVQSVLDEIDQQTPQAPQCRKNTG